MRALAALLCIAAALGDTSQPQPAARARPAPKLVRRGNTLLVSATTPERSAGMRTILGGTMLHLTCASMWAWSSLLPHMPPHLKAGRPDWDTEFRQLADHYGRENIGVVFCGAPLIAAALKEACEKHSKNDKTMFRLHKENF